MKKILFYFGTNLGFILLTGCAGGHSGYTGSDKDMTPYIVKISGDNQAIAAGQILPDRFTVQLKQDVGQITSWNMRKVTFTAHITSAGGEFIPDSDPNVVFLSADKRSVAVFSGPNGLVSSPRFSTNASPGTYEVSASAFTTFYPDKPGSVTFSVTNN